MSLSSLDFPDFLVWLPLLFESVAFRFLAIVLVLVLVLVPVVVVVVALVLFGLDMVSLGLYLYYCITGLVWTAWLSKHKESYCTQTLDDVSSERESCITVASIEGGVVRAESVEVGRVLVAGSDLRSTRLAPAPLQFTPPPVRVPAFSILGSSSAVWGDQPKLIFCLSKDRPVRTCSVQTVVSVRTKKGFGLGYQ
jgi:hypothetical protein